MECLKLSLLQIGPWEAEQFSLHMLLTCLNLLNTCVTLASCFWESFSPLHRMKTVTPDNTEVWNEQVVYIIQLSPTVPELYLCMHEAEHTGVGALTKAKAAVLYTKLNTWNTKLLHIPAWAIGQSVLAVPEEVKSPGYHIVKNLTPILKHEQEHTYKYLKKKKPGGGACL